MIVIVFLLARILGAQDYGRLTLAQGLVNSLQIFVVLGAGSVLARYIPKMREEGMHRAVEIINLCGMVVLGAILIFVLLALGGAHTLMSDALAVPADSPIPGWMVAWVVLTAINSLLLTIMLSLEKGRTLGLISLLGAGLSIALVPLAASQAGVQGAIGALVIVEIAKVVALSLVYARFVGDAGVSLLISPRRSDLPVLMSFGLPMFLQSALWGPTIWLAQVIVKNQASDGLTAVGIFGFTNNILGAIILVSGLTNRAALPILSSLEAKGSFAELRRASFMMTVGQAGAAIVIASCVAFGSHIIMAHAGAGFQNGWPVLIIMAVTGIVMAAQTSLGNYLLIMGRQYFVLITIIPSSMILLGSASIFSFYGSYALAGGLLAASALRSGLFLCAALAQRSPAMKLNIE